MYDILKLTVVFIGIVVAIRRRVFVGYTLFFAGLMIALFFQLGVAKIFNAYREALLSERFIALYLIIVLITFLGRLLREIGYLNRLVAASRELSGGARTASAVIPSLVGLMPMPGGSLLSAPLVAEVLPKNRYRPEFVTAVNYWSRHVVEFCWPVYPGIILSATLAAIPVGQVSLLQLPMTVLMIPIGIIFLIRKIKERNQHGGHILRPAAKILLTVWPILLAIILYAALPIRLLWAVASAVLLLIILERPSFEKIRSVAREAFSVRLFILLYGIISFQAMLEATGAVGAIPQLTTDVGLPAGVMIIAVCFVSGLLTGMVAAFVGLSYPILAGYLYQPDINLPNIFLAYISGYFGMMLSPTHFCLVLTAEYFRADLGMVYRVLAVPLSVLFFAGLVLYLCGYPGSLR
ncbi:MAG: DUF401 family protein [Candidatus Zixiibacteriota bacterium]|nr:MAG: DUF401 family protein [candidate division Zixibacteria bacterium]